MAFPLFVETSSGNAIHITFSEHLQRKASVQVKCQTSKPRSTLLLRWRLYTFRLRAPGQKLRENTLSPEANCVIAYFAEILDVNAFVCILVYQVYLI